MRSPIHSTQVGQSAKKLLVMGAVVVGLLAGQLQVAQIVFGYDVITQVEDILHQAAATRPS